MESSTIRERVPASQKLSYAFSNLGCGLLNGVFSSSIVFFYNNKLLLEESLIGYAFLLFAIWNAVNDPIFGFLSDKTKNEKLGRRIPYLRYGAPLYGIAFIFVWFPFTLDQLGLFVNLLVSLFVFDTLFTMIGLVLYAMLPEIAFTQVERAKTTLVSNLVNFAGIITSFLLPALFLTDDTIDLLPFQVAMIVVAIVSTLLMYGMSFILKENPSVPKENPMGIIDGVKHCFKNKVFLVFEGFNFTLQTVWAMLTAGILYYVNFVLGLSGIEAFIPVLFLLVSVVAGMAVFSARIERIGVKRGVMISLATVSIGFFVLYFLGRTVELAFPVLFVMGFGLSGGLLYASNMFGDICDYDEMKTGVRREGTYSGINALVTKPAISVGTFFLTTILAAYGFDRTASVQGPEAIEGIMVALTLVPGVLGLVAVAVMKFYPVGGESWIAAKKALHEKHVEREREYMDRARKPSIGRDPSP